MHQETRSSVLSNFTITAGGQYYLDLMGGVYLYNSSPTILNNIITYATCYGIDSQSSSPLIQGNEISYVQAQPFECSFASGAGIWLSGQAGGMSPLVLGNTIENNTESGLEDAGGNGGAGIAIWGATAIIQNNIIRNNATGKYFSPAGGGEGGGIYFEAGGTGFVANNLIYGNTSNLDGGGIAFHGFLASAPNLTIINNTIVDNAVVPVTSYSQAVLGGQQLYFDAGQGSVVTFSNNLISGSTTGASVICYDESNSSVTYLNNDFYNAIGPATGVPFSGTCTYPAGTSGNVSADPMFTSAATTNYHLQLASPAIDKGDNTALQLTHPYNVSLSTDLDGNPRIQDVTGNGCIVDMGAYEYPGASNSCPYVTETLQSSLNPSVAGQTLTFTAQLSSANGVPTGSVQFTDGSTILGTATVSGTGLATINTGLLAIGSHTIAATYQPTGIFAATTANLVQVVTGYSTATTVTSSLNPAGYGQPITFSATVSSTVSGSGPPSGTTSFTDGATLLATLTLTANGSSTASASLVSSTLGVGIHTITATYVPTGTFAASTATATQTIIGAPTTTILAPATTNPADALQPVTLSASVSTGTASIATGTITFFDGTTALGTATLDPTGHTTFITSTLTTGIDTLHAVYSGDTSFATSISNTISETITANPTLTTLSISPTQPQAFQFFTVNFSITSLTNVPFTPQSCNPTCTVTLNITGLPNNQNSTVSAPVLSNGISPFRYALAAGTYTFTATFNGSPAFASSTSTTVSQIVIPAATTLTLGASPITANQNQSVAVTSVLTAPLSTEIPSGAITLLDGATPFATAPFSGNPLSNTATINAATTTLSVGTHIITASYPGSPNFLAATSTPITIIINPNDYALSAPTSHPIIPTEHYLPITVNLSSIGVFTDQVVLSCTNLPVWTTCTFDHNTLPLTAGGTATTTLTIDTSSVYRYAAARNHSPSTNTITAKFIAFALTLPAGILGLFLTRRRKLPLRLTLFFLTTLAATVTLTGCTGMYPLSTPPGVYTLNITAGGATTNISHTLPITLTVTP